MTKASHGAPRQKQSAYRFHNCRWDNLWLMKTTNGDTRVLDAPKKKSVALGFGGCGLLNRKASCFGNAVLGGEIETVVNFDTTLVETVKVAVLAPAATRTLAGAVAAAVLLLERVTVATPVGAGPVSVTVPVDVPPLTLVGFNVRVDNVGGFTVRMAVFVTP